MGFWCVGAAVSFLARGTFFREGERRGGGRLGEFLLF